MPIVFSTYIDRLDRKKKHKQFITCAGCSEIPVYEYKIVDGIKSLVSVGTKDIQPQIESYAESTDINNIINRFVNGEVELLNVKNGTYGDFTNVPTTYAEMFSRVQQCENLFNQLPVEIRESFDNSYMKFWEEFGSDKFDKKFEVFNKNHTSIYPEENGSQTSVSASAEKGVDNAE